MGWLEALILGLVQGLTEYLPVSSSGHLTIGQEVLGVSSTDNLAFDVVVHVATVCSTLVILWKEVAWLLKGIFVKSHKPGERLNEAQRYLLAIIVSMIPVGIVGVFFKDYVEEIFGSGLLVVGCMLLVTAALLAFSYYAKPRQKEEISLKDAFVIGVAQAAAVMPGLSRSGSTIATGLLLGNKKEKLAQFSFLMVIPPILGEALLNVVKAVKGGAEAAVGELSTTALIVGFLAAFVSGCFACKWMIDIVKRGKLIYFAIYCAVVGAAVLIYHWWS
ncbi:MAG: undecaprenyl-diphosphate phosphatase [Prevotella sp.]|nr:undecaprenyl-diphosphate phosphatase [Prevotella sp.]MBR6016078.1 undecaprenyl-diphosphate phosphatase [Prevotella sp.]